MPPSRAMFVLILTYLALLGFARMVGDSYCALWLPILRVELKCLLPVDTLLDVGITNRNGELVYAARVSVEKKQSAPAGKDSVATIATVSTLTGNALQPPIVVLSLILARVNLNLRRRCLAAAIALPVIAVLFSLDVPFVLAGAVVELLHSGAEVGDGGASLLTHYANALDHGGRFALAMVAAAAITEPLARWGSDRSD